MAVYEQEELVQEGMADGAGQVGSGRTHAPSTTVSLDRQNLLTMVCIIYLT